jgi:hypothetical protein
VIQVELFQRLLGLSCYQIFKLFLKECALLLIQS